MALSTGHRHLHGYACRRTVPGQGRGGLQMVETIADQRARVLRMWNELDVPENFLVAQVTPEGVLMSPPAAPQHSSTVDELNRILVEASNRSYRVHQTKGMWVAAQPAIFVPDFMVVARGLPPGDISSEDTLLVAEITSPSNVRNDRVVKYHAYAKGGVAQYLLIDPVDEDDPSVTLFSEPSGDEYTRAVRVPYGESLTVEQPFPIVIDTGLFPLDDEE
ncbi:Uma2 family endonuclease [Kineosporia sp. J2-2]|uniref:Uma2 family endonuclease n=1 Tax=Kineosporia corallincola TaxID=2835133 RepID=A0ABS5TFG8_9ACTN|nr:Uma2 family endonuclease [Kineosporia corallincola]MBT0768941.1 Uma2 family endonuclease [Kineosporia corallincola]